MSSPKRTPWQFASRKSSPVNNSPTYSSESEQSSISSKISPPSAGSPSRSKVKSENLNLKTDKLKFVAASTTHQSYSSTESNNSNPLMFQPEISPRSALVAEPSNLIAPLQLQCSTDVFNHDIENNYQTFRKSTTIRRKSTPVKLVTASKEPEIPKNVAFGIIRGSCSCGCSCYNPKKKEDVCECGHWPMKHKHLGKKFTTFVDVINNEEEVAKHLLNTGGTLVSAFCMSHNFEQSENLIHLINVFAYADRAFDLMNLCILSEVHNRTVQSDPNTIFREDKLNVRIITQFIQMTGKVWLEETFGSLCKQIIAKNLEFETEATENAAAKINVKNVKKITKQFIDVMINNIHRFPQKIIRLCSLVESIVKKTIPNCEFLALISLIFLRFICPSLCNPAIFMDLEEIALSTTRGFIYAAKIIQSAVLKIRFHPNDSLSELNEFMEDSIPTLKKFTLSISSSLNSESLDWNTSLPERNESLAYLISFAKSDEMILNTRL